MRYLQTVAEHAWDTGLGTAPVADPADEFCRLASLTYSRDDGPARWDQARRLLAEHPGLTTASIWAAAAAARPDDVDRLLTESRGVRPSGAARFGGGRCSTSSTPDSTRPYRPTGCSRSPGSCSTPAPTPTRATSSTPCRLRSPC